MPYANMLVQRRAGRVTAYAAGVNEGHGHGQFPEKYAKFAYDTRFGFCASRSREVLNQAAPDSMLAFVIDDNVFVRKVSKTWEIEAGAVTAQWSPFPGIEVTTTITPRPPATAATMKLTAVSTAKPMTAVLPCPILHRATPKARKTIPPKPIATPCAAPCAAGEKQWSSAATLTPACTSPMSICRREVPHPQGTHGAGHRGL